MYSGVKVRPTVSFSQLEFKRETWEWLKSWKCCSFHARPLVGSILWDLLLQGCKNNTSSFHPVTAVFTCWYLPILQLWDNKTNRMQKKQKHIRVWLQECVSLLAPIAPLSDRRSGMDWLGTLFLIRRMAWGETLIWTSSAWKKTALPGWAQRTGTANYTTLKLPPRRLKFTPSSVLVCVCVCDCWLFVWAWESHCIYRQFVFTKPRTRSFGMDSSTSDINNFVH